MIPMAYRKGGWDTQWWRGTKYQCRRRVMVGTRYERRCFNYAATCPQHSKRKAKRCGCCGKLGPRVTVASQVIAYLKIGRGEAREDGVRR